MGEVRPFLFIAQLFTFAATLPSPFDTIMDLAIIGALLVFGVGAFGIVAGICDVVSNIVKN